MPAYLSAAEAPVSRGTVTYVRTGVALADLVLAVHADRVPSFTEGDVVDVTLTDADGQAHHFVMACRRLGIEAGHWRTALRGGRGRLGREIPARFYRDADGTRILADALTACGEVIAADASLPERLPAYVRRRGPAFADVRALLSQYPEATWRVLPDGAIYAGRETWPEAPEPVRVVQQSPQFDRVLCEPAPEVLPGMRVEDEYGHELGGVERVVHQVTDRLRTELWLGEGDA